MEVLDLLIIGGGPIGIACAIEADMHRLSYRIIEKGTIADSIYRYPLNMKFFSTSEKLEIAGVPFITASFKPGRREALEYYQGIAKHKNLQINLYEKVLSVRKKEDIFETSTSKSVYFSKNVIIATGFYDIPNLLNIPGENLPKVKHYYTEPYPYIRQKVAVIGASNSAVDAALETYRKGAEVTMIIRGDKISENVKYWIKPDIENRIKEESIRALFESEVTEVQENTITVKTQDRKELKLENDFVLAMTGYLPDFNFLRSVGIDLRGELLRPVYNSATMETNVKNLYLAGVVCGGTDTHLWFIENSRIHASMIVKDILGKA